MTTKPPPLSEGRTRPGRITIRQYHSTLHGRWWALHDWRPGCEWSNDLRADTFRECLDHLRGIEAQEIAERVTTEPTA